MQPNLRMVSTEQPIQMMEPSQVKQCEQDLFKTVSSRDSENDFWGPKIGSDNSRFSFFYFHILLSFLAVSLNDCCFLELTFVSGAD